MIRFLLFLWLGCTLVDGRTIRIGVASTVAAQRFGGITLDFSSGKGNVTFTAFDDTGSVLLEYSILLDVLRVGIRPGMMGNRGEE